MYVNIIENLPAYVGRVMLRRPLARRCSFRLCNGGGPGCWRCLPGKQAVGVPDLMFVYTDPLVSRTAPLPACTTSDIKTIGLVSCPKRTKMKLHCYLLIFEKDKKKRDQVMVLPHQMCNLDQHCPNHILTYSQDLLQGLLLQTQPAAQPGQWQRATLLSCPKRM